MSMEGKPHVLKILVLRNLIYKFYAISVKIPTSYFVDSYRLIPKLMWKAKGFRIASTFEEEQSQQTDTTQLEDIF